MVFARDRGYSLKSSQNYPAGQNPQRSMVTQGAPSIARDSLIAVMFVAVAILLLYVWFVA